MNIKVNEGCIWEGQEFEIITPYDVDLYDNTCRHCGPEHIVDDAQYPGGKRRVRTLRAVVVATNEGGYSTTGVCLDCILDSAKTL